MNLLIHIMECMQVWFHGYPLGVIKHFSFSQRLKYSSAMGSYVTSDKLDFKENQASRLPILVNCALTVSFWNTCVIFVKPRWTTTYSGSECEFSVEINGLNMLFGMSDLLDQVTQGTFACWVVQNNITSQGDFHTYMARCDRLKTHQNSG